MSFDPQKHFKQTQLQFVIGFVVILIIVGFGLIFYFYGSSAAVMGIICVATGVLPVIVIYMILKGIENYVNKINNE
jgi:hypothetical protein